MQTPLHIDPQQAFNEIAAFQRKLAAGMQNLRGLGEQEYANTPREAIYREDKLTVWHMKGNAKPTAKVPTLIVYALVNTVWMTDLQDDRSLVRNLLAAGRRCLSDRLGLSRWCRSLADAGRLPQRLSRSLRRCAAQAPRPGCDQPARHLPGRHLLAVLYRDASGEGEEPGHHGYAGRFPAHPTTCFRSGCRT